LNKNFLNLFFISVIINVLGIVINKWFLIFFCTTDRLKIKNIMNNWGNDFYSKITAVRRLMQITPCKRSAARGKKMQRTNSELRSSSTSGFMTLNSYGVQRHCSDISTPSCATLARGYSHFTPSAYFFKSEG
jgi:hypothetical protein